MSSPAPAPDLRAFTGDRLRGTVSFVTGASSGIGEATARLIAALGGSVVLMARGKERLDQVVTGIRAAGGTAVAYVGDTTDQGDLEAAVATAQNEFGRLDYAVNNAGMPGRGPFLEIETERFDQVMNVNLRGVFLAMRAELPPMLAQGSGAIVNTASVGGLVGVPNLSAYTAGKHAVVGLTKSVALEYATSGIRINAVAPGGTDTAMLSSGTQAQKDALASLAAMKRISRPEEIARTILYLLVDATFTTGAVIPADGGQSVS
ncbi:MAG: SDR family oxidoreductase [Actinoplanes sp.]